MEEVILALTNVTEESEAGAYTITLPSGEVKGSVREGTRNGRHLKAHLDAKKYVEKYAKPPEPTDDEKELAQLDSVLSREIEDVVSILTVDQQEAFYAKTDKAPEGKRKRVAMERKKVLRASR